MTAFASSGSYCNSSTGFCSGSDGQTLVNVQQNTQPQIYIGEIGNYIHDFTNPKEGISPGVCPGNTQYYEACFQAAPMAGAMVRKAEHQSLGFAAYYLLGGAQSTWYQQEYSGWSPYCWGWAQGGRAVSHLGGNFKSVDGYNLSIVTNTPIIFADIEGNSGWVSTTTTQEQNNRYVFDGFSDYIAGRSPASNQNAAQCLGIYPKQSVKYQYGIYSLPNANAAAFQEGKSGTNTYSTYLNTPLWTTVFDDDYPLPGYTAKPGYPGDFSGFGYPYEAAWFGDSNYHFGWQFWSHGMTDYDIFSAPITFYVNGITLGG